MTDEAIEQARAGIKGLFDEVREDLAEDLGCEPEDYRSDNRPVGDGGNG